MALNEADSGLPVVQGPGPGGSAAAQSPLPGTGCGGPGAPAAWLPASLGLTSSPGVGAAAPLCSAGGRSGIVPICAGPWGSLGAARAVPAQLERPSQAQLGGQPCTAGAPSRPRAAGGSPRATGSSPLSTRGPQHSWQGTQRPAGGGSPRTARRSPQHLWPTWGPEQGRGARGARAARGWLRRAGSTGVSPCTQGVGGAGADLH